MNVPLNLVYNTNLLPWAICATEDFFYEIFATHSLTYSSQNDIKGPPTNTEVYYCENNHSARL